MIYTELTKKALVLCFEAHKNQVDNIIYSYLQAIGVINAHGDECFLFAGKSLRE